MPFVAPVRALHPNIAIMVFMSNQAFQGRRWIWQRLQSIEQILIELKLSIDKIALENPLREVGLEQIKYQIAAMEEGNSELEKRLDILEKHNSTVSWVIRQFLTIALVIVVAYFASILF